MQMMAECVYAATFSMRDPKGIKVQDMFPMLFEETDEAPDITEEEAAALQAEMDAWNWSGTPDSEEGDAEKATEENPDISENAAE